MLRVLYAGSPAPSAKTLRLLYDAGPENSFEIAGILTNPPGAQGRHKTPIPTPVAQFAAEHSVPLLEPEHLDAECRAHVAALHPDILVCFAYGHIFGPKFMALFPFGGINLHPSALPEYRGCAPVQAAILNRNQKTAFTVQRLAAGMDEGNILAQQTVTLNGTETSAALLERAATDGAQLIVGILKETARNGFLAEGVPQQGEPSYTSTITKADAKIDWNASSAEIDAAVRAYTPEPCCWTTENNSTVKILTGFALADRETAKYDADYAARKAGTVCAVEKTRGILIKCGCGFYCATALQREGKKPMNFRDFVNGARNFVGTELS